MKKNGKRKKPVPRKTPDKTAGSGKSKVIGGSKQSQLPSQRVKPETKKQLLNKGFTPLEAGLIHRGYKVTKGKKIRVSDLKTGRFAWISVKQFPAYEKRFLQQSQKKAEQQSKYISDTLDIQKKNVKGSLYENITDYNTLSEYTSKHRLRNKKGHFLKKEEQEKVLKFAKELEKQHIEFNLKELTDIENLNTAQLRTWSDKNTPSDFFYWSLQNNLENGDFAGKPIIEIIDFDGNVIYSGTSIATASMSMNKYNHKLDNLETLIDKLEDVRPYFTIPVSDEQKDGFYTYLKIDYSGVKSRLTKELHEKYRDSL